MKKTIVLGSSSSYRKALLSRICSDFETQSPDIDETAHSGENARQLVQRLALEKAMVIAQSYKERNQDAIIIGSDQVLLGPNDEVFGKSGSFEKACEQLGQLNGQKAQLLSAMCVIDNTTMQAKSVLNIHDIKYRQLSTQQIAHYLRTETPYDCAGSAKIEGLGIALLESIEGDDPTAIIGLPLISLSQLLFEFGHDVLAP